METRKKIMDITERLDNPDMTFDAVDEAIREIKRLRHELECTKRERDEFFNRLQPIVEIYMKFDHQGVLLGSKEWCGDSPTMMILNELWKAVEEAGKGDPQSMIIFVSKENDDGKI